MREVLNANPIKLMQRMADQNISFLRSVLQPGAQSELQPEENPQDDSKVHNESPETGPDQSVGSSRTTDRSGSD
jgi:hypothetical protein